MTEQAGPGHRIRRIGSADPFCGFRCGIHSLDDYFRRYAFANNEANIGKAYVAEASAADIDAGLPAVIGFYTLSMAAIESADIASVMANSLPRYPMPVALIGRLAVDERARGRRVGEMLLLDALAQSPSVTPSPVWVSLSMLKTATLSDSTKSMTSSPSTNRLGPTECSCR